MYASAIVDRHEAQILRGHPAIRQRFPRGIPRPTVAACRRDSEAITRLYDDKGQLARPLTPDEESFVIACQLRVVFDAEFFLSRFVYIDQEGHGLRPLYPLWESQRFLLDRLAALEVERETTHHPDGLLVNILKARQLGFSTLCEALVAHRVLAIPYTRALVGADVEEQAAYLFQMVERLIVHLPPFLQPERLNYRQDRWMAWRNHSTLRTAWGKSTRGGLQETGGAKGNIGRGKTPSVVHISELSTWEHPEQLDDGLLPGIPVSPQALVAFESTAKGAGNWWHQHWLATQDGHGRFRNVFVPWGIEPKKYALPAPANWTPATTTLDEAKRAETEWPQWIGRTVTLTREQLYWYETTRAYHERKNELGKFKEEYATTPEDCFLYSGRSIFTIPQLEAIDAQAHRLIDVWAVEPARDIAELRRLNPEAAPVTGPPLSVSAAPQGAQFPIPPGYGFRRLPVSELKTLGVLRDVLAIYEYPRARGRARYVMAVDVSDGLGLDDAVIDIIRCGSVEEPPEQVATYVTNRLTPTQLAHVCDAVGRLYSDSDGLEACAAVECNIGPGLVTQNELQLHLGYTHFYVWEVLDAGDTDARFTKRIGWATTQRTRPIILSRLHEALTTADPISGRLDFCLNSPIARQELRSLLIPAVPGATLGDAAAAPGQKDDSVMTAAIGHHVAYMLAGGETEPISEQRRRRTALQAQHAQAAGPQSRYDYRNSEASADDAQHPGEAEDDDGPLHFDERAADLG